MAFSSGRGLSINPSSPGGDPICPVRETRNTQPFLISLYCRLKVKSNCLSSPDPSCISTDQRSTLSITTLKRRAPTVTHNSVCVCVRLCSGGRAPQRPSSSFLRIYMTAEARASGCLFTLLASLLSPLQIHLSGSFRKEKKQKTKGTDASSPSFFLKLPWLT